MNRWVIAVALLAMGALVAVAQNVRSGAAITSVSGAGPIVINSSGVISCPSCATQGDVSNATAPLATMIAMNAAISPLATSTDLATVSASIPLPSGTVPYGPAGTGTGGVALTYIRGDAAQKQPNQRMTVTTDASGNFSGTWATAFSSSTPIVLAAPLNASLSAPFLCSIGVRSATTVSGKCWQIGAQSVALISLNISLAPAGVPTGTSVMITGSEPTQ